MNRKFTRNTMTKFKPKILERELPPKVSTDKNGAMVLLCPFCDLIHPIQANIPSPCGTLLRVMAVQSVYKSKEFNGMICAKCGEGGGEMTKLFEGFVHLVDCKPGTKILMEPPPFSRLAKFAYGLKDGGRLKNWFIKKIGIPQDVQETTPGGEKTGKILGYVFYRSN